MISAAKNTKSPHNARDKSLHKHASKAVSTPLELWSSLDFPHLKPAMRTHALVVVALLIGSTPVDARGHVVYTGVVAVAVVWR